MKNYQFIAVLLITIGFLSCKDSDTAVRMEAGFQRISGQTMGTTYNVSYLDEKDRNFKLEIDSLLIQINQEVSTYVKDSYISKFNQSKEDFLLSENSEILAPHFYTNFQKAKEIYKLTEGEFDVTVMPLVNYWGFGYKDTILTKVDSMAVDSILSNFIGFSKVQFSNTDKGVFITKKMAGIEVDFSALAKGYGVDQVYEFLIEKGVENCMIEIGGEVRTGGKNDKGHKWAIGINEPKENAQVTDFQAIVELENIALATSGNYRNYYLIDSLKYSHTINPSTGFPEINSLLSASIFAKDCMTADALATACMVIGLPNCAQMIEDQEGVEGYFIYGNSDGKTDVLLTSGTPKLLRNSKQN